ncbi:MAG: hypothetical protein DHS20C15_16230 [Planctomycetota bacterium]|nr:MAG: hypothetical protein DHS20C15_16230 [Planctomycetota bacterium]
MRTVGLLVLAASLAAVAWWCHAVAPAEVAAVLPGLHAEHEDTRSFPAALRAAHAARQQSLWRERCALLAAALALGVFAQAVRRDARGPSWRGAVGVAALGVLAFASWASITEQARLQREGRWALSDRSLPLYAGPLSSQLAEWRGRVGPHDAVLLAGRQDLLLNVVATALHGRPIYPLLRSVPAHASAESLRALAQALPLGDDAPKRWLVDLDALGASDRNAFAHPTLFELTP